MNRNDVVDLRKELIALREDFKNCDAEGLVALLMGHEEKKAISFVGIGEQIEEPFTIESCLIGGADSFKPMALYRLLGRAGGLCRDALPLLPNKPSYTDFVLRHNDGKYLWAAYLITGYRLCNGVESVSGNGVSKYKLADPRQASILAIDDLLEQLPVSANIQAPYLGIEIDNGIIARDRFANGVDLRMCGQQRSLFEFVLARRGVPMANGDVEDVTHPNGCSSSALPNLRKDLNENIEKIGLEVTKLNALVDMHRPTKKKTV